VYIVSVGTVAVKIASLLRRRAAEIRRGRRRKTMRNGENLDHRMMI
jgi:hypothetical protein